MTLALLIAQVDHGPELHGGPVLLVLVAMLVVGALAYLLVRRGRRGSTRD